MNFMIKVPSYKIKQTLDKISFTKLRTSYEHSLT